MIFWRDCAKIWQNNIGVVTVIELTSKASASDKERARRAGYGGKQGSEYRQII